MTHRPPLFSQRFELVKSAILVWLLIFTVGCHQLSADEPHPSPPQLKFMSFDRNPRQPGNAGLSFAIQLTGPTNRTKFVLFGENIPTTTFCITGFAENPPVLTVPDMRTKQTYDLPQAKVIDIPEK